MSDETKQNTGVVVQETMDYHGYQIIKNGRHVMTCQLGKCTSNINGIIPGDIMFEIIEFVRRKTILKPGTIIPPCPLRYDKPLNCQIGGKCEMGLPICSCTATPRVIPDPNCETCKGSGRTRYEEDEILCPKCYPNGPPDDVNKPEVSWT